MSDAFDAFDREALALLVRFWEQPEGHHLQDAIAALLRAKAAQLAREVERRREAEAARDQWNADARRLSAGLLAIHDAPESSTIRALCSVAYDIALNCIDAETARFQIARRSAQVERQGGSPDAG